MKMSFGLLVDKIATGGVFTTLNASAMKGDFATGCMQWLNH